MSKDELRIDMSYSREATKFSLPPKGQEDLNALEIGKCNYYTDRAEAAQPSYICNT